MKTTLRQQGHWINGWLAHRMKQENLCLAWMLLVVLGSISIGRLDWPLRTWSAPQIRR